MINVAVIFGGESYEHDISIITGVQLLNRANMSDYNLIPIYISREGKWYTGDSLFDLDNFTEGIPKSKECILTPSSVYLYLLKNNKFKRHLKIDACIMCLHGGYGEGGGISALLGMAGIPYSACDLTASAVCLDKVVFKNIMNGLNIKVVDSITVSYSEYLLSKEVVSQKLQSLSYPIIIKPAKLGSSIGIVIVNNEGELFERLEYAFRFDNKVLIEKYVSIVKEINIAIIEDKGELVFSETEEPISGSEILSFDDKYKNNPGGFETIKRVSPARINEEVLQQIKSIAGRVYKDLGLFGVVRFDFILDNNNELYMNEVNTIPGSMANYLFDKEKYPYTKLIGILISNAISRFVKEKENNQVFESDILKSGVKLLEK